MFIFYPIIIALGIYSSYTDIRFKIIKNKHLFLALAFGIIIYIYLILSNKISIDRNWTLNILISFFIGLLLYLTDIWGAGDAKLFVVLCFLMPRLYSPQILPFPCVIIFMNIFLLSLLGVLFISLGQIIKRGNIIFKEIFSVKTLKRILYSFLVIFSISWVVPILIKPLGSYLTPLLLILTMYFSYLLVYNLLRKLENEYLVFGVFAAGLAARFLCQPAAFSLPKLSVYFKNIFYYTFIFYVLSMVFELNKKQDEDGDIIAFAPFMLIGALMSNTDFIYWVMQIISASRR